MTDHTTDHTTDQTTDQTRDTEPTAGIPAVDEYEQAPKKSALEVALERLSIKRPRPRLNLTQPRLTNAATNVPDDVTDKDRRYVEIANLTKAYPNPFGQDVVVVKEFNLIMRRGEVVSVIGHSGCGKSTVLTMLAGLNPISSGGLVVSGRQVEGPGPDRAVVFQSPCLLPWMTAFENVMLGVKNVYAHGTRQERRQICEYYLSIVGLGDSMHKYPREMSGGMQQRVGIARAIALKPRMLLLDEPLGRLDSLTRMDLQDVILDILDREKITTMLITHDVDEAIYLADRVVMMTTGPEARVGKILETPFERPRVRKDVLEHPDYYNVREQLILFLEDQEKHPGDSDPDQSDSDSQQDAVFDSSDPSQTDKEAIATV